MNFFNEEEKRKINNMCPACQDLYTILEKAYDEQEYNITEKQVYILNHACSDFEWLRIGDIVQQINKKELLSVSDLVVTELNVGKHCPVLEQLGRMGDCFYAVVQEQHKEKENEFDFDKFVLLGNYSGIEYVNAENENEVVYKYLGNDEYLYYYVYIPYINDYKFSYKTTNVGSIIVSFYDEEKNNISADCTDIIENGKYNKEQNGIIIDNTEIIIPCIKSSNTSYFQVGFKVEQDNYFSEIILRQI